MSSLTKIVITGKVVRNPEKRFTGNNLPITSFTINIGDDNEEKSLRVFTIGKLAETAAESVIKDQRIVVEGNLQTVAVKTDSGFEKKVMEINARGFEIIGVFSNESSESSESDDSSSADYDLGSETAENNLIGEDEIPF